MRKERAARWMTYCAYSLLDTWNTERMNISVDDSGAEIAGKGLQVEK
jgi:hypothetical protein